MVPEAHLSHPKWHLETKSVHPFFARITSVTNGHTQGETTLYIFDRNRPHLCYACDAIDPKTIKDKNSSEDEIANVNFLRRYGTYVLQNTKKENLLRLTN